METGEFCFDSPPIRFRYMCSFDGVPRRSQANRPRDRSRRACQRGESRGRALSMRGLRVVGLGRLEKEPADDRDPRAAEVGARQDC
jgi:hypothetical protein